MNRRDFVKHLLYGGIAGATAISSAYYCGTRKNTPNNYNVLFIIGDDLRPQLGCCGERQMVTPHIDKLASGGVVFDRSYCQQALCAPSRASLLTGLRPDSTGIYNLKTPVDNVLPHIKTLPLHFKQHGYQTAAVGKVFHHMKDSSASWTYKPVILKNWNYATEENRQLATLNNTPEANYSLFGNPTEMADLPDNAFKDGQLTDIAINRMRKLKDKPFFLCVGYARPHLPYSAPKKYWNLYDPTNINLPANPPPGSGILKWNPKTELNYFHGMADVEYPIPGNLLRHLIHGYYASVSFLDAQVGCLLEELNRLKLNEKTIVILWGDNGYKLGEHGSWGKNTNYETDTRVPLIIGAPGMKKGVHSKGFVEAVDIYPSLCELCGLDFPDQKMEGTSFVPLTEDPQRPWKTAAFSQNAKKDRVEYSMRTDRFRYCETIDREYGTLEAQTLFDHSADPGENVNVIDDPRYAQEITKLEAMMKKGWNGALPPNR